MSGTAAVVTQKLPDSTPSETPLPRRDWVLLPLLSVVTIAILAISVEVTARRMFSRLTTKPADCMILSDDPSVYPRGIPRCECWSKVSEGELTNYRFNSDGYRMDQDFGPKPPGVYRIVLLGTSNTFGAQVPRPETFAGLLPDALARKTGMKVEVYNQAMTDEYPSVLAAHFDEALKFKPDMILWTVNQTELKPLGIVTAPVKPSKADTDVSFAAKVSGMYMRMRVALTKASFADYIANGFRTRTVAPTVLSHYIYGSSSQHMKALLAMPEWSVGYLRTEPSAAWHEWLTNFDRDYAKIAAQAKHAGIPLVVTVVPKQEVALMLAMGEWPSGYDPYKMGDEMRRIVESHGGTFIDILPDIRSRLYPGQEVPYLRVEGHLNAQGQAMISDILLRKLTSGAVPALSHAAAPALAPAQTQARRN